MGRETPWHFSLLTSAVAIRCPRRFARDLGIGDDGRPVHRVEAGKLWVIDVITHDDIGRYGRPIKNLF
jgi:hypothetical protein